MAKTKPQKEVEIKEINSSIKNAKSVVFTTFNGLSVKASEELRHKLRQAEVIFKVSKKTLLKKSLSDDQISNLNLEAFSGNIGVACGLTDEIAPAKILAKFAKDNRQLEIQGGLLEQRFITKEKVMALASLPSHLELIGRLVATIDAPVYGLARVLCGNLRGLMNVLNAVKENKQ